MFGLPIMVRLVWGMVLRLCVGSWLSVRAICKILSKGLAYNWFLIYV